MSSLLKSFFVSKVYGTYPIYQSIMSYFGYSFVEWPFYLIKTREWWISCLHHYHAYLTIDHLRVRLHSPSKTFQPRKRRWKRDSFRPGLSFPRTKEGYLASPWQGWCSYWQWRLIQWSRTNPYSSDCDTGDETFRKRTKNILSDLPGMLYFRARKILLPQEKMVIA